MSTVEYGVQRKRSDGERWVMWFYDLAAARGFVERSTELRNDVSSVIVYREVSDWLPVSPEEAQ